MERTVMTGSGPITLTAGGEPPLTGRPLTLSERNAIYDALVEMGHTPSRDWVNWELNTRLVATDLVTLYRSGRP